MIIYEENNGYNCLKKGRRGIVLKGQDSNNLQWGCWVISFL
jgi:hypothetical protein